MQDRLHPFEAIDNFRDYGGYSSAAGRRIAPGRLYRSAHHAKASEADLARLRGLGIVGIVDLRRPSERAWQPSRRCEGFRAVLVESEHDDGGEAPHITFLKEADLTEASGRAFMVNTYGRLPFEPAHLDLFARYFRLLADTDGPVLIHCAAGKDRTGLLAALTHQVLGVSRDDMLDDYLLTNTAVDLEGRAPEIGQQLERMTGRKASHGAIVAFMGVEAAYLDAAFRAMDEAHGSVDGYLQDALGMTTAMRDRIADRLTA